MTETAETLRYDFPAYLYDGKTAGRKPVTVKLSLPGYIVVQEFGALARFRLDDVTVSDRLGSQPARIELPDNVRLEVPSPAAFYAALADVSGSRQWLHAFESRWALVLLALALTAALGWAAYVWGIPAAARQIAFALPREVDAAIGQEGLELLDGYLLAPTELDDDRRRQIDAVFGRVVNVAGAGDDYQLVYRRGAAMGANALALPAGIVVLTDELVQLAEHDEEIAAVLAHEIGHVRNRHALRALLQNSTVAGFIVLVTGDINSAGSIAAGIPTVLAQADYSRDFETEADAVAREYMEQQGVPLHRFADIIVRLDDVDGSREEGAGLLSTHPAAVERARNFR